MGVFRAISWSSHHESSLENCPPRLPDGHPVWSLDEQPIRCVVRCADAACLSMVGCGTTREYNATEQLVMSDAVDRSIASIDFRPLSGRKVYLDTSYLASRQRRRLRQQRVCHQCAAATDRCGGMLDPRCESRCRHHHRGENRNTGDGRPPRDIRRAGKQRAGIRRSP